MIILTHNQKKSKCFLKKNEKNFFAALNSLFLLEINTYMLYNIYCITIVGESAPTGKGYLCSQQD